MALEDNELKMRKVFISLQFYTIELDKTPRKALFAKLKTIF